MYSSRSLYSIRQIIFFSRYTFNLLTAHSTIARRAERPLQSGSTETNNGHGERSSLLGTTALAAVCVKEEVLI